MKKRKLKRNQLITALAVFDAAGVAQLGVVVDITVEGIGLRVLAAMEPMQEYDLRVMLPAVIQGTDHFIVKGRCMWCRNAPNPDMRDAGLLFCDLGPVEIEIIEELVRRFGRG